MKTIKTIFKWLVVFSILYFLFKTIADGYPKIENYPFKFNSFFMLLSFPLFTFSIAAPTWAWISIIQEQGYKNLPFFEAYKIWFNSFMGRYIPGKVALIVIRARLSKKYNLSLATISNVAILEVFLLICTSILISLPMQISKDKIIIWPVFIFLILGVMGLFLLQNKVFINFMGRYLPLFRKIKPLVISKGIIFKVVLIYIIYWILRGFAVITFLYSFLKVRPGDIHLIISGYALAYVSGILAVFTPAGLGVREITFATFLQPIYGTELSYVIAVVVRLWATFTEVLLWVVLNTISSIAKNNTKTKSYCEHKYEQIK